MRKNIELTDSVFDMLVKMAEGNPGAVSVLSQMLQKSGAIAGPMRILDLDDMNIRGPQIWIGYKDHCKEDITLFIRKVFERDSQLVAAINEISQDEIAVTHGGSWRNDV